MEKHVGIFFLFSDLQGFSAAITQKCYQMPLAIVGPKNHVSAQSQSVFQDLEKEMLFFFFTPMKF